MSKVLMPENGQITPAQIYCSGHFWNAFDHPETEVSAKYIVQLCQEKGGWVPFSEKEIEAFYNKVGYHNFNFNRLIKPGVSWNRGERSWVGGGWIVRGEDDLYRVTAEFVVRCYNSSPTT